MSEEAISESDLEPSLNSEEEYLDNEEEEDMEEDEDENDGDDEDDSVGEWQINSSLVLLFSLIISSENKGKRVIELMITVVSVCFLMSSRLGD